MNLILSLFPGIGLFDLAFEEEGFTVVRGPDVLWGGDIRRFHPPAGKFDGVIGGPPCQSFSSLVHLVRANGHEPKFGNLIPEFERCVAESQPEWFVMENVPKAPVPVVPGYGVKSFLLDNSALMGEDGFGLEQRRVRRFSFGMRGRTDADTPNLCRWIDLAVFLLPDATRIVTALGPEHLQGLRDSTNRVRRTAVNAGHDDPNISLTAARRTRRRQAVLSDPDPVPVKIGGNGKLKRTVIGGGTFTPGAELARRNGKRRGEGEGRKNRLADALHLQGLPPTFLDDAPFTADGKLKAIANGVPIPMGRAIARAVQEALQA